MEKLMDKTERIAKIVTKGYEKLETGVVGGYERMQTGIVRGFTRLMDRCVQVLFAKQGESVEAAKTRLRKEH